jgi:hypothetical protein
MGFDVGEPSKLGALLDPFEQPVGAPDPAVDDGVLASEVIVQGQTRRHHTRRAAPVAADQRQIETCNDRP